MGNKTATFAIAASVGMVGFLIGLLGSRDVYFLTGMVCVGTICLGGDGISRAGDAAARMICILGAVVILSSMCVGALLGLAFEDEPARGPSYGHDVMHH